MYLMFKVLDENDNNPFFVFESGSISVLEDTPPGTPLAVISAKDFDSGEFGKITYLMDHIATQVIKIYLRKIIIMVN